MGKQIDIFGKTVKEKKINKIDEHWIDMPEYISNDISKPQKIAIIKFRNEKDFDEFNSLLKKYIFKSKFQWGTYKTNVKTLWFPPPIRPKDYAYVDENDEEYKDFEEMKE